MLFQPQLHSPTTSDFASKTQQQTSSRILYDIPCKVCTDHSSGKHYGIFACDGCAGFFKRSIRRNRIYVCKAKNEGSCVVDKTHRNQCRACRLKRCVEVGMNKDAVQHERGPRNSTLRRQMSLYFKDHHTPSSSSEPTTPRSSPPSATAVTSLPSSPPQTAASPTITASTVTSPVTSGMDLSYPKPLQPIPVPPMHHLPLPFIPPPPPPPPLPPPAFMRATPSMILPPKYPPIGIDSSIGISSLASQFALRSTENLSETAARLLFMNVRWAQHVPAFTSLPYRDQLYLLEESWRELFLLSSAQFNLPVELAALTDDPDRSLSTLTDLKNFQDAIQKFQGMRVDTTEFACLRAIILLKTSLDEQKELRDSATIASLQDQAQLTLSKYISSAYPTQPMRFGKLLLLLPSLKSVSSKSIEELFFKRTIGSIPIERIICDMYKAGQI